MLLRDAFCSQLDTPVTIGREMGFFSQRFHRIFDFLSTFR